MGGVMAKMPLWKGRYPMSDTAHEQDLQMRADINEHMYRMPRHDAEAKAHADYRREQIAVAAGHHWNGMKASHAAGNEESAKKHGMMYALAMHQLGHKDLMNPPPEVVEAAKDPKSAIGHFKAHHSDVFSMPPEEPSEEPQRGALEPQVKAAAALKKAAEDTNPLFQKQGYQNHPVGATGGGLKHDQEKQDELIDVAYHGKWPQEHKYVEGALGTKANFVPPEHNQVSAHPSPGPEGSLLAGALVARQAIRYLIRKHAARRGLLKAEDVGEYPEGHKLGMRVPMGGSSCAKCSYVSEDLKKCSNVLFQEWNDGPDLPAPAAAYCCDLYEIKKKGSK